MGVELQAGGMPCVGSTVIKKELNSLTKEIKADMIECNKRYPKGEPDPNFREFMKRARSVYSACITGRPSF